MSTYESAAINTTDIDRKILRLEITNLMEMINTKTQLEEQTTYEDLINLVYIFYNKDNTQRLSLGHNKEINTFTITLTILDKNFREANMSFALMKSSMLKIIKCLENLQFNLLDECLICHNENLDDTLVCNNCRTIANLL